KQFIENIRDHEPVHSPFLVKFSGVNVGKTGKPYMNLVLMDKTGEMEARIWDDVPKYAGQVVKDAFIWVDGKCQVYQGRRQIVVKNAQVLREDQVTLDDYVMKSDLDAETLYSELLSYVASMQDPYYRALAEAVLKDD